jgi:hypothetical protein
MKKIILFGMAFVMMLVSLGGCFFPYEGRGGRGGEYDRGDRHDRDDRGPGPGGHEQDRGREDQRQERR